MTVAWTPAPNLVSSAVGFIPGSDCITFAADAVTAISRNAAQERPAFSVQSGGEMFWSAYSGLSCAADFAPPISLVLDSIQLIGSFASFSSKCLFPGEAAAQQSVASLDPNEIVGPLGGGEQHAIPALGRHTFALYFENSAQATGPAQEVHLTMHVDPAKFDLSSVEFGSIQFGNFRYTPPSGTHDLDRPCSPHRRTR